MKIMYANPMIDLNEPPPVEILEGENPIPSPNIVQNNRFKIKEGGKWRKKRLAEMSDGEREQARAQASQYTKARYSQMKAFQKSQDPTEREKGNKFFAGQKAAKARHRGGIKERKWLGISTERDLNREQQKREAVSKHYKQNKTAINKQRVVYRRIQRQKEKEIKRNLAKNSNNLTAKLP